MSNNQPMDVEWHEAQGRPQTTPNAPIPQGLQGWQERPHPVTNDLPPPEIITALGSLDMQTGTSLYDIWFHSADPNARIPAILHMANLATTALRTNPSPSVETRTSAIGHENSQRSVNKALLKDIRPIDKYGGKIHQSAAQQFLLDCERYFEEISLYVGQQPDEKAKVVFASGKLVDRAGNTWKAFKQKVSGRYADPIETFADFKAWIEREFSEHLGPEKRWDHFDSLRQGTRTVQAYAMELQQAAVDTGFDIPEAILIQHLRKGANMALQQRWVEMNVQASTFAEAEKRLIEFERGRMLSNYISRHAGESDPDAMDLSALPAVTNETKRDDRVCFNCGKPGHIRKRCREERKKPSYRNRSGNGFGRPKPSSTV
ncbi:hypothetical protein N7451_001259 [Penicillium sp. IBT 35674x]|nr:hypothetical protein N7451_009776 [Penicillium sp. IBT 35674x]KAJ6006958.1 hypothetical protein N7451_004902 [Penicillium sp. IBT 35674x]KAJ6017755.1 hypothetical protein N7451_001134 [Penicillium sp. IBT 35674x]KAJ6017880.1 hypothetical protein N7451_001259 [Penicillium sp. IBT 35674x]